MREVLLANDGVLVSYVEALLRDAGIEFAVLDRNSSAMQFAPGLTPHRVMVREEQWHRARQLLTDADLGPHLSNTQADG